jgi:hypothetical protein
MARRKRILAEKVSPVEGAVVERAVVIDVPIIDIVPYENNPRINIDAVEIIANSIKEFGFNVPILLDRFGVIIAGHTRYAAAKSLGYTSVPSIYAEHLTENQAKAFRIVDNKSAEKSFWDEDLLPAQLEELSELFEFTEYGFGQDEMDIYLGTLSLDESISPVDDEVEARNAARGPSRIKFTIGEFVFHIDPDIYRLWSNQIRTECDFSEDIINQQLKSMLGLSPYEEVNEE